jgi:signal transduction histidine kinase
VAPGWRPGVRLGAADLGRTIRSVAGPSGVPNPPQNLPRGSRWTAVVVLTVFVAIGLAIRVERDTPLAIAAAAVAAGAGAVLVRSPRGLALPCAVVATGGVCVLGDGASTNVGWFAVCVLSGCCVLFGGRRDGLVYWAGALGLFGAEWLWAGRDPGWGPWAAGVTFTTFAFLLVRHELDLVAQLRVAQTGLAGRARAEERNRIARELHDVIAHTLTVSLLHVTSARLAVEYEPEDAARALAEAERLGRETLAEVRAVVGLLREDAGRGETMTEPLPGVEALPELVERFRLAGADITVATDGDTGRLAGTTGLGVYRIVQESLTNAVKHAPGVPVRVSLRVEANAVELAVDSAGHPGSGAGLGLIGMKERAESLGGSCQAGPGGHGWLVRARLPLTSNRQTEAPS